VQVVVNDRPSASVQTAAAASSVAVSDAGQQGALSAAGGDSVQLGGW
jgi:hypothetical protein